MDHLRPLPELELREEVLEVVLRRLLVAFETEKF
jgi:hypothetical protein